MNRLHFIALLVLLLAACAPVTRVATDTLNNANADGATLAVMTSETTATACGTFMELGSGFCFDPAGTAEFVEMDVQADVLTAVPDACTPSPVGATCIRGIITDPWFVPVDGIGVSALVAYRRPDSPRVYTVLSRR